MQNRKNEIFNDKDLGQQRSNKYIIFICHFYKSFFLPCPTGNGKSWLNVKKVF